MAEFSLRENMATRVEGAKFAAQLPSQPKGFQKNTLLSRWSSCSFTAWPATFSASNGPLGLALYLPCLLIVMAVVFVAVLLLLPHKRRPGRNSEMCVLHRTPVTVHGSAAEAHATTMGRSVSPGNRGRSGVLRSLHYGANMKIYSTELVFIR